LTHCPIRLVRSMASQHHASRENPPHFYHKPSVIALARKHNHALSELLLCLLLFFAASCAQHSSVQTGQASSSAGAKLTYVAIGASDSFGIGTNDPYNENWPTDLTDLLGANHIHLIDAGIPGITTHEALSLELPIALDAHPGLVTIWLGVNDIVDTVPISNYTQDLDTLLGSLRTAMPNALIAIANIPDLTLLPFFGNDDPRKLTPVIQEYNRAISNAAQQYHAILVNLSQQNYNLQAHPEYISDDGLHPDVIGYQQLAKLFYTAIQAAQKQAATP